MKNFLFFFDEAWVEVVAGARSKVEAFIIKFGEERGIVDAVVDNVAEHSASARLIEYTIHL